MKNNPDEVIKQVNKAPLPIMPGEVPSEAKSPQELLKGFNPDEFKGLLKHPESKRLLSDPSYFKEQISTNPLLSKVRAKRRF
jgi:hypothetical protein